MSDRRWWVERLAWREERGSVFGVRRGFEAEVRWPDRALWVSRLEGEDRWVADARGRPVNSGRSLRRDRVRLGLSKEDVAWFDRARSPQNGGWEGREVAEIEAMVVVPEVVWEPYQAALDEARWWIRRTVAATRLGGAEQEGARP
jgi:hypothetical protein